MTQFSTPTARRVSGDIDVYTGLLFAAMLVMLAGAFLLATANMKHSASLNQDDGGMFKVISKK